MEKKIKKIFKSEGYDFPVGDKWGDLQDIASLWYTLENELNLNFSVNVSGNDEQYLEAVYWCDKLKANVVLDSGVKEEYEDESEIVEEIETFNKKIIEIESKLK